MRADLAARLHRAMRGETIAKTGVTGVAGVTGPLGLRPKPQELRQLRPLRVENDDWGKDVFGGVIEGVSDLPESVQDAIEERAALCAGCVPAIYLDAWARLNHQKPMRISDAEWRLALDDGGRFLDRWGSEAALWGWTAGDLFDVPREGKPGGLIWFIARRTGRGLSGRNMPEPEADGFLIGRSANERICQNFRSRKYDEKMTTFEGIFVEEVNDGA